MSCVRACVCVCLFWADWLLASILLSLRITQQLAPKEFEAMVEEFLNKKT